MSFQQHKRFNKLRTDAFYLLDRQKTDTHAIFHISGSTKNIYTVTTDLKTRTIDCNCPDGKFASKNLNVKCKHCLFVLIRVLRLFKDCTDTFFDILQLTEKQLQSFIDKYDHLDQKLDQALTNINLTQKFNKIKSKKDTTTPIQQESLTVKPDTCCGVCFDDLYPDQSYEYHFCDMCGNAAHQDCVKAWRRQHDTCMYCRAKVSKNKTTGEKTGWYDNLA